MAGGGPPGTPARPFIPPPPAPRSRPRRLVFDASPAWTRAAASSRATTPRDLHRLQRLFLARLRRLHVERNAKGHGSSNAMAASGELHADARIQHGFSLGSLLAEFRALRATVLRRCGSSGASDLADVRRVNESVDEAVTVWMTRYGDRGAAP